MKKLAALLLLGSIVLHLVGTWAGLSSLQSGVFLIAPYVILGIAGFYVFRNVWFYRDPKRVPDKTGRVILSPADGRVMYIRHIEDGIIVSEKLGERIPIPEITKMTEAAPLQRGWLIGVYMTPADVHYNYAPHAGVLREVVRYQAKISLPMVDLWEYINFMLLRRAVNLFSRKFHFENERTTLLLEGLDFSSIIVLIADRFVNKIALFVEKGASVGFGQKIAFISRGSQADIFIGREDLTITIREGQQVYAGKTVLAEY